MSRCCGLVSVTLLQCSCGPFHWKAAPPVALSGSPRPLPSQFPLPRTLVDKLGGGVCLLLLELVVPTCRPVREASLSSAKVRGTTCPERLRSCPWAQDARACSLCEVCVSKGGPGIQRERTPTPPSVCSTLVPSCPAPSSTGTLEPGSCGECGGGYASFLFPQLFPSGLGSSGSAHTDSSSIFSSLGSGIRVAQLRLTGHSLVNVPSVLHTAPCPH